MNARLRAAFVAARVGEIPRTNIERAIKKASGTMVRTMTNPLRGLWPGGVAVIVEALTDNRNRAASDIRFPLHKSAATRRNRLVAFMFDRTRHHRYDAKARLRHANAWTRIEAE